MENSQFPRQGVPAIRVVFQEYIGCWGPWVKTGASTRSGRDGCSNRHVRGAISCSNNPQMLANHPLDSRGKILYDLRAAQAELWGKFSTFYAKGSVQDFKRTDLFFPT